MTPRRQGWTKKERARREREREFVAASAGSLDRHHAAERGAGVVLAADEAKVRELLRRRVSPDARDDDGRTALMRTWSPDIAALLIQRGASLEAVDAEGRTALHHHAEAPRPNMMECLLEHGANLWAADHACRTPLEIWLEHEWYQPVRSALEKHTRETPRTLRAHGIEERHIVQLRMIGWSRTQKELRQRDALFAAIREGDAPVVDNLLAEGAPVDMINEYSTLPLPSAIMARRNAKRVVKALMGAGADPRLVHRYQGRPIGYSVRRAARESGRHELLALVGLEAEPRPTGTRRDIQLVELYNEGGRYLALQPGSGGVSIHLGRTSPRAAAEAEPVYGFPPSSALTSEYVVGFLKTCGCAWVLPYLADVANGAPIAIDDIVNEYKTRRGEAPRLHRQPTSDD